MLYILYVLLIIVFLIIIKQFYFSKFEYFHPVDESEADEQDTVHTHIAQIQRGSSTIRDRGGSPAQQTTEETTSASTAETTSASSDESNETTSAVETTAPSDTIQASVNNQQDEQTQDNEPTEQTQPTVQIQDDNPNRVVSEAENLRLLLQLLREQRSRPDSTQPVITAASDSECCGLNIYNNELQNINKCLEQHLVKQNQSGYQMIVDRYKSVDDRSCKNPPHILVKTTNCSGNNSVIGKYYPHLTTLHRIATNLVSEDCAYSAAMSNLELPDENTHRNLETSNPFTPNQQMGIFLQNIDCGHRGLGNNLARRETTRNGSRIQLLTCSENPN